MSVLVDDRRLTRIAQKLDSGAGVSMQELQTIVEAGESVMDMDDLLPLTLNLDGYPMDVKNRRPMFNPLFKKVRQARKMIFLCGRQLGKSCSVAAAMLMNLLWRKNFSAIYLTPLELYTNRMHHVYMGPMQTGCNLPWKIQDQSCSNNVKEKSYLSGGHYYGVSLFDSPRQVIGLTSQSLWADEVQDIDFELLPYALETLGAKPMKWETYTGTARGIDNTIQTLFDTSSQAEWHMRCTHCGHVNIPMLEEAIKMIQPAGIGCARCSTTARPRLLDVRRGWWHSMYPEREKKFMGYHIPQIIVHERVTPHENYVDIYDKLHGLNKYSPARFQQEILGISSEQGGRPITRQQITDACTLRPNPNTDAYSCITGGADWGGSEVTSFTVGTLVGLHYTGKFHCLGAVRPVGIQDNFRHLPLAAFFKDKGGRALKAIGGDAGFVGGVQNPNLGAATGVPCASISYGMVRTFFKASGGKFNLFTVDRSTLIYITLAFIIEGHLLLPNDPAFEIFWNDLLAITAEDMDTPTGTVRRYARIPSKADDFLHALGYALFICGIMSGQDLLARLGLPSGMSVNRAGLDSVTEM